VLLIWVSTVRFEAMSFPSLELDPAYCRELMGLILTMPQEV
jgi:hypothetical protein